MADGSAPDVVADHLARAEALREIGRPEDALALLAALPPQADVYFLRAAALYDLSRHPEALREVQAGLADQPDSGWGLILLGHVMLAQGRHQEAADGARAALASAGPSTTGLVLLSAAQGALGQASAAALAAHQAVELDPSSPDAHAALSRARQANHDQAGAEASARRAVALAPHDPNALAALAEHLERTFRLKEAQQVRLRAVTLTPEQDQVDALSQVTVIALAVTVCLNALVPVGYAVKADMTPSEVLVAVVSSDVIFSAGYLLLRRVVHRSLSRSQRRGLRPGHRLQERALLLAAAAPLVVLLPWWTWQAGRGGTRWTTVAAAAACAGVAVLVAQRIEPLPRPAVDWRRGFTDLRQETRWRAIRERAHEDRLASQQLRDHTRDAPAEDAPMFLRNARFVKHAVLPASGTFFLLLVGRPYFALGFVLVFVVVDAVLTDRIWPGLAARHDLLWRMAGFHLRVVDTRNGRAPSTGRSALRGLLRLLLCPLEISPAFRKRHQPHTMLHDRLTATKVVRLP